jgi:hypothetical protein
MSRRTRARASAVSRRGVVRVEFRRLAACSGFRRRFAPHQLRYAHALELAREGVPLNIIQRQLGHANLGTTSIYLHGIDPEEIIATVHAAAGDVGQRRAAALIERPPTSGSATALRCTSANRAPDKPKPHDRGSSKASAAVAAAPAIPGIP